jgi:hypothetical protein
MKSTQKKGETDRQREREGGRQREIEKEDVIDSWFMYLGRPFASNGLGLRV